MPRTSRTIPYAFLLILGCAILGGLYGAPGRNAATPADGELQESLRTFTRVFSAIEENYADPVNTDKAVYKGAIPGMLRTLDPHSNFFDPKAYGLFREDQRGKYYGVGMTVVLYKGRTMVVTPFEGSPAYKAGIRPGDFVAKVDGKSTDGLGTAEVADMLKGPRGTQVHIQISREGTPQPLEFSITRDAIPRHSVELAFEIQPRIGYIGLPLSFSENTSRELGDALSKLDQRNLKGLILDLRENPGGILDEGVNVADMFLHKGQVIVSHRGRASTERSYPARHGNGGNDFPLVVLINRNSASASEIVAGAIQDHDRGLVLGETSFGKGLVQNVYPLSDNTGLALTIAKYYTPSGRLIQRDFNGLSLYDYYYTNQEKERNDAAHDGKQVRSTDSGRLVYGGGGITPDVRVEPVRLTRFQQILDFRYNAFFNFARHYIAVHQTVSREFQVTDGVLNEFHDFLDSEKIPTTTAELRDNRDYISGRIKQELFSSAFGKSEGDRLRIQTDPLVLKAVDMMPLAKELVDNVRKILAQKTQ